MIRPIALALALVSSPAMAERIATTPFDANPWPVADERYNAYSCSIQYIAATGPGGLVRVGVVARQGGQALQRITNTVGNSVTGWSLTGRCSNGACHNFICIFDLPSTTPKASWRASACIYNAEADLPEQTTAVCIPAN